MQLKLACLAAVAHASPVLAAFGATENGDDILVDTVSATPFTFVVNAKNCDVTSIKYRGEELQYATKASQLASGLGTATVAYQTINSENTSSTCFPFVHAAWANL